MTAKMMQYRDACVHNERACQWPQHHSNKQNYFLHTRSQTNISTGYRIIILNST